MTLREAIDIYVQRRRALGFLFLAGQKHLSAFSLYVRDQYVDQVTTRDVEDFLNASGSSTQTWRRKYGLLKRFFEFWFLRDAIPRLPLPLPRRPLPRCTFIPYIYTRSEIRSLLAATGECQNRRLCSVDSQTFRYLLLTLYATGAMAGEILNLRIEDVSFRNRRMRLRGSAITQPRIIPICPDLQKELQAFAALKHSHKKRDVHFFFTREGQPLREGVVRVHFQHLRRLAGVERHDGASYQPRMHDLRSTFAVHQITSWIRQKADLNRMLPALSAYMGSANLATTERYLALAPERFRRDLRKLSPQRGRKRWRDDPALMRFLATL